MGRSLLVFAIACTPAATPHVELGATPPIESKLVAAYGTDATPGMRARIVCAVADASPRRWSDVVVHGEATVEACELLVRGECEGHGDLVRGCSPDPLPAPLVPRGSFVLKHEMPEAIRYESVATADECESARAERENPHAQEWLDGQIALQSRELEETKDGVRLAERRLAEARTAQRPDVALVQLEVERLRKIRDMSEKLLAALRDQKRKAMTIACGPAGGA